LIFSPIVALLSLYMSITYGLLYLLFTTITSVFRGQYGWQPDITGLAFLGIGIGMFLGVAVTAKLSDATVVKLAKRNGGIPEPEMRLPSCIFFGIFLPIALFWYGWSADKHSHWIVPILGLIPFGFGMIGIFIPVQTYLIDAFPEYAASVTASLTASRSLFGAFLPMAGPKMYSALGLGWGNTLLGFLAIAMLPFLPLIYKYGRTIREKWPVDLS
jgi:MFS family permease